MPIRVAVVEDYPLMLQAVVRDLEAHEDIAVVGTAVHGAELHRLVRETFPDVVILDLGFAAGGFEPVSAVRALRQRHPRVQVLVLTAYDNAVWVRELLAAGVRGLAPDGARAFKRLHRSGNVSPKVQRFVL